MRRSFCILAAGLFMMLAHFPAARAQGLAECGFSFDITEESSALQALVNTSNTKGGFWLSITEAPSDIRKVARYVGRLQICLITPDGKPRTLRRGGKEITLPSPFVTNCTAALLPENRLLTNRHCYYDPDLMRAGFTMVQEARVNFNYTARDMTSAVRTYRVGPRELDDSKEFDALLLQVIGDPVADIGGHFPTRMLSDVTPYQDLVMIHHPGAQPQQYSTGTCKVHRRQSEIDAELSALRHTCETTGGSSGSLLLDARTLAAVGLHNQGGLRSSGDGFNGGHKFAMVNKALNLGFAEISRQSVPDIELLASRALADAFLQDTAAARVAALRTVAERFPDSDIAETALSAAVRIETMLQASSPDSRDEALTALSDALLMEEPMPRMAALAEVIARFPGTDSARRAERALELDRADQDRAQAEVERLRNSAALTDLAEALTQTGETARLAALEAVADAHSGTEAATRALEAAQRMRTAIEAADRESADGRLVQESVDQLANALLVADPTERLEALIKLTAVFPGTDAAARAEQAAVRTRKEIARLDEAQRAAQEQAALNALTEALLAPTAVDRVAALRAVAKDHRDTSAGDRALRAVLRLEQDTERSSGEDPESSAEALLTQARLRCALQSASPFDLQRPINIPGIRLGQINADAAVKLCSAPAAEAAANPATSFALARALEAAGDLTEAKSFYRLAAAGGYVAASTALGRFERDGLVGVADVDRAIRYFETAAEAGDPVAMTFLSDIYEVAGGRTRRDFAKATEHLERAAAMDHPHAVYEMGKAYEDGTLYPKDLTRALALYERASELGDVRGTYDAAMIYWRGERGVVDKDILSAFELLVKAAEAGDHRAQHRIGMTYLYGHNDLHGPDIPSDLDKALYWLSKSAENGYVQAQVKLGKLFDGRGGVEKDEKEALRWYLMAAEQDFVSALVTVARIYEDGKGTAADPVRAARYWMRTMELGSNVARLRTDWSRETAEELQRQLQKRGYYDGRIDGAIGNGSKRAMKAFINAMSRNLTYLKSDTRIKSTTYGWSCQC